MYFFLNSEIVFLLLLLFDVAHQQIEKENSEVMRVWNELDLDRL